MTAFSATPERIISTLERFPVHIQRQFLIDRMDMYLGHGFLPDGNGGFRIIHIDNPEEAAELLQFKLNGLKKCKNVHQIFWFINKPDRLQVLQFLTGVYIFTKEDYAELLRDAWISTEFPHQMPNAKLIRMFESADRHALMTDDEHKALDILPDAIPVYRGYSETNVRKGMTKRRGLSWTLDKEKAIWFAKRWSHSDAKLLSATASKTDVYIYTNVRGEQELVVNPKKLKKVKEIWV